MASKGKIEEHDIIDKKVYDIGNKIADSLDPAIQGVEELETIFIQSFTKIKTQMLQFQALESSFKGANGFSDFMENIKKLNVTVKVTNKVLEAEHTAVTKLTAAQKEQNRISKGIETTQARLNVVKSKNNELLLKERFELQKNNKLVKEAAILSSTLASKYQQESIKLEQKKRRYKDLALTKGIASRETKKLKKEITQLDSKLKQVDKHVGEYRRSVGNYAKGMASAFSAIKAIGINTIGLVGASEVIRDAFNSIVQFDESMQNLAGVMRTTRGELKPLEQKIISVASTSVKTSTEVAKLSESLATLGKSKESIQKLLSPVVDLGIGLNTSSEEAGEFLIQMLNAFGASDDEALKYADTIATIRTSTTLDFQKMRDSFQYIAPISKILNKDLAYTGSVVGILADNSLKAESAGRLLATAQQRLSKGGLTLNDALDQINTAKKEGVKETDLLKIASELFGAQAAKVGVILAENTDKIEENAQAIRENSGALDDLVNQQLESVSAKLKIVKSAWEAFIFSMENGRGTLSNVFKGFLTEITKGINALERFNKTAGELRAIDRGAAADLVQKEVEGNAIKYGRTRQESAQTILELELENVDKLRVARKKAEENLSSAVISYSKRRAKSELNDINKSLTETHAKIKRLRSLRLKSEQVSKSTEPIKTTTSTASTSNKETSKASNAAASVAKKAANAAESAAKKRAAAIRKRQELLAKDRVEYNRQKIQSNINTNKLIVANESNTYTKRILANTKFYQGKLSLLQYNRAQEIKEAKGGRDKIASINSKYNSLEKSLEAEKTKATLDLAKKRFAEEIKSIKKAKQEKSKAEKTETTGAQDTFNASAKTPKDVEAYEKKIAEIKKRYALESIQVQIDAVNKLLEAEHLSAEQKEQLSKTLSDLKITYSNVHTSQEIKNAEDRFKREKELAEQEAKLRAEIYGLMAQNFSIALNINASDAENLFKSLEDSFKLFDESAGSSLESATEKITAVLGVMDAAANITHDIFSATYEANIEKLNEQLDASNEYYDTAIERAEGDENKQNLLREEKAKKEAKIKKEIAKEKTKAAKADRNAAIVKAGINTALAVTAALSTQPFLPLGPIMAGIAGVMGLAQVALIASKPIPKFKEGTRNFDGGLAWLGDGGVSEIYRTPDGVIGKTPNTDTLYDLPKGTDVFSSEGEYMKLMNRSVLNETVRTVNIARDESKVKPIDSVLIADSIKKGLKEQQVHYHTTAKVDLNYPIWRMKNLDR